jgi:ribosomal protein L37E
MARRTGINNIYKHIVTENCSGVRFHVQKGGLFICGKPKEIRSLLKSYASRYRTVNELITQHLN